MSIYRDFYNYIKKREGRERQVGGHAVIPRNWFWVYEVDDKGEHPGKMCLATYMGIGGGYLD